MQRFESTLALIIQLRKRRKLTKVLSAFETLHRILLLPSLPTIVKDHVSILSTQFPCYGNSLLMESDIRIYVANRL